MIYNNIDTQKYPQSRKRKRYSSTHLRYRSRLPAVERFWCKPETSINR